MMLAVINNIKIQRVTEMGIGKKKKEKKEKRKKKKKKKKEKRKKKPAAFKPRQPISEQALPTNMYGYTLPILIVFCELITFLEISYKI